MKALTLRQPWATRVAFGVKTIETRSWPAPKALIGDRIAIHAAKTRPNDDYRDLPLGVVLATARLVECVPIDRWSTAPHKIGDYPHEGPLPHQLGGLWLIGPGAPNDGTPTRVEDQRPYGNFRPGRWAWLLDNVEPLVELIPAKGHQRLWEWTP